MAAKPPPSDALPASGGPPKPPPAQRLRGVSFKRDYLLPSPAPSIFDRLKAKITGTRFRQPSMIQDLGRYLIPAKAAAFANKITVVLDLDETIVFARQGPLYARPYTDELLRLLKDRFEGVVWTAGVRAYAQAVVRNIDKVEGVQHCVYRHKKWFSGVAGYNKDLRLLGRDLPTTIIFENTPDCVRGHEDNGIIVPDYEGGEFADETILGIIAVLNDLLERRHREGVDVPTYIKTSKFLKQEPLQTDSGGVLNCWCLDTDPTSRFALLKSERANRDLPPQRRQIIISPECRPSEEGAGRAGDGGSAPLPTAASVAAHDDDVKL